MPAIARSEPFREQACPLGVCDGSGWILGPEDVARPCECREQRLKRGRSRGVASVIPPRYRGVSFDRPPVSDMARDLRDQGRGRRGARLRRRARRAASTRAAASGSSATPAPARRRWRCWSPRRRWRPASSVAIYSLPKLLARIRRTYDSEPGGDSYLSFFERLTSVDLLHIDDLGAEKRSDWVLEQLYALVNERYEAQRSVLVTTNLPHEELEEQIGARTVSRLSQICDEVPLFGDDRRYGKAA